MPDLIREPVVILEDVSFTYPGSEHSVLNHVSLTLREGDFTAIIGSNGSGKSTLCKLFNGLIPHYYSGDFSGEVTVCGQSSIRQGVAELSRHIGYVYQDFENQLVRPTVLDDVSFTPLNYGCPDYRERGERALKLTGLEDCRHEFIWQLSGGQKHLLALAGALAMDPKVLVIDEPVAQLDPQHAREIYDILRRLNSEYGITVVVIEHHAEFIAEYCRDVVLMDQGSVIWKRPVHEALSAVEELLPRGIYPPQVTLAAARLEVQATAGGLYPTRVGEAADILSAVCGGRSGIDGLAARKEADRAAADRMPGTDEEPLVKFARVDLSYRTIQRTSHHVLNNIELELYPGESVALVGNNGAGKSSLLKLIAGIVKPTSGDIRIRGVAAGQQSPESLSGQVSYVFQNPEEMFIEDTVRKEIAYYLKARHIPNGEQRVDRIMEAFRLQGLADRDARLLSGGQQRRVSLAIGAVIEPSIMLLDEPTANLDISTKQEMLGVLKQLHEHVSTVVIATHDMQLVAEWASRIIVLHQGRIIAEGTRDDIFSDDLLLRKAGLEQTQLMRLSRELGLEKVCCTLDDFVQEAERLRKEAGSWKPSDAHLTVFQ